MNSRLETVTKDALPAFAQKVIDACEKTDAATVLALTGDLGAGKTAFVKALAAQLGVSEAVTSPTFTIMRGYETEDDTWEQLLHMDAYRIEDASELQPLRFQELLTAPNTIFCIEWADLIKEALPADALWLHFSNTDDESVRSVQIT
jgi:tRNA threonylcarbamoyladenosine biosynthesis protein TsaE